MNTHASHGTLPRHLLYAAILLSLSSLAWAQESGETEDEFSLEESSTPAPDPEAIRELTEVGSWIEFGVHYVDDDSFRFGRYRGLEDKGGYGVLNLDWYQRAAYDAEDPSYVRIRGNELGLSTRSARVEFGRQGDYRVRIDYAQMPATRTETGATIFDGAGGNHLTLPDNWVGAQNTGGMTQLLPSLGSVEQQSERRRVGVGLQYQLPRGWGISTRMRHEHKDGIKSIGAVIGNSGGNPRAVILPEPIDYDTREADIALSYADDRKQLEFKYLVSLFDEGYNALVWDNPYTAISGWNASAGFPTGQGQLALPPDNEFHQFSIAGGYSFAGDLRASGDVAFGRMTQNEAFLPYTINPTLAASIVQPLPRDSLDGKIDTTVANLRIGGRPTTKLSWNASVSFDDRDNQTPRDEYVYIGGDSATQNVGATSSTRRFNEPYSYQATKLKIDGAWRAGRKTNLNASLTRTDTERTYSEREEADETTFNLNLRHAVADWFSGALHWTSADRGGSTYHGNEPFLSGYAPGYTSTVPGQFENAPGLRKYFLADRDRQRLGASLSFTPGERWNINLDASELEDDYDSSELGVTAADSSVYTLDIGYAPNAEWFCYAFASRERMDLDQNGVSTRGGTRVTDAEDPARAWSAFHRDAVHSTGAGVNWEVIDKKLDIGADYLHLKSRNAISVITGASLTSAPLPINHSHLSSLSLNARYRVNADWDMHMRVWREHFRSSDFSLDGIEANQLANVILLGEQSPDYDVDVVTLSFAYRF
jgi:MtrB/PioB family decaheme-associated outer membrane protein